MDFKITPTCFNPIEGMKHVGDIYYLGAVTGNQSVSVFKHVTLARNSVAP